MGEFRVLIPRSEPLITLKPFRYLNRRYVEGNILDRRKTRMPSRKLSQLINRGFVELAKNTNPEKLAEYGFVYDSASPRRKLVPVGRDESMEVPEILKVVPELETKEGGLSDRSVVKSHGGGWYDVIVDGKVVNSKKLRKHEAIELREEYK